MYDDETNLCWRLQKGLKRNWFDAREECSNQGAHLMILNTTASLKLMQNYLQAGKVLSQMHACIQAYTSS